jgi:hypothetical protein
MTMLMIDSYTTEEVLEFYNDYMKDGKPERVLVSRYEGRLTGKGTIGKKTVNNQSYERVREAHFSIVHQIEIVAPYIEQHLQLRDENEDCPYSWIMKEHKHCFTMWLKDQNLQVGEENIMGALAQGPS